MIAILGGLGAAAAWALSTVCSSRSSRLLDPASVVAWVMLVGLLMTAPVVATSGIPRTLHGSAALWLAVSAAGNVGGLLLAYGALRIGQVALVAPLMSTEGAIAAIIALSAGESVAAPLVAALAVITVGICLTSMPGTGALTGSDRAASSTRHVKAALMAMLAALAFGTSLYATARAGSELPAWWIVISARLLGALVLAVPLAVTGRLRLTAAALPLVVVSGICEVLGVYSYTAGSRHGIAVTAVLSSQFGMLAAGAGYLLFRERLARVQLLGVVVVAAGVAALSALRA